MTSFMNIQWCWICYSSDCARQQRQQQQNCVHISYLYANCKVTEKNARCQAASTTSVSYLCIHWNQETSWLQQQQSENVALLKE